MSTFELIVSKTEDGLRLDLLLTQHTEIGLNRSQVKNLITDGQVTINKKPILKSGHEVSVGDKISLHIPEIKKIDLTPQSVDIKILFEDEALAVVYKPAGISVHPSETENEPTVVHGLLHKLKSLSAVGGVERPGIVHRIDKGTSGVLVISKTDQAHQNLAAQFKAHTIERVYRALIYGDISTKAQNGRIETFFGRNPSNRKKMTGKLKPSASANAKPLRKAITNWKMLSTFEYASEVECRLETGRTHQIRVHFAEIGFGVIGDPLYGEHERKARDLTKKNLELGKFCAGLKHQMLHAQSLRFDHPLSGKKVFFEYEPPTEYLTLRKLLAAEKK